MNSLLNKAVQAVNLLPQAEQIEVAEGLLSYVDILRGIAPLLTEDQLNGVLLARRAALEGKFASDDEITATWRKFEVRKSGGRRTHGAI